MRLCGPDTDGLPLHGQAEVIVLAVVFHASSGPIGNIVVFIRHKGFNVTAAVVEAALCRLANPQEGILPIGANRLRSHKLRISHNAKVYTDDSGQKQWPWMYGCTQGHCLDNIAFPIKRLTHPVPVQVS